MQQMTDNREYPLLQRQPFLLALGSLPWQYVKTIARPSAQTLNREVGKARWSIVLVQLLILAGITVAFNALGHLIPGAALHAMAASSIGSVRVFGWLPAPLTHRV